MDLRFERDDSITGMSRVWVMREGVVIGRIVEGNFRTFDNVSVPPAELRRIADEIEMVAARKGGES